MASSPLAASKRPATASAAASVGSAARRRPKSAREFHTLLQQLRNTLKESEEAPPDDADLVEITNRRRVIKSMLAQVESSRQDAARIRSQNVVDHHTKALEDQIRREQQLARKFDDMDVRSATHSHEFYAMQRERRSKQAEKLNNAIDEAARRVNANLEAMDKKVDTEMGRRQTRIEHFNQSQFQQNMAMKKKHRDNEELMAATHRKHAEMLAKEEEELERFRAQREKDQKARMARVQEMRERRQQQRNADRRETYKLSNTSKVVVTMQPQVKIAVVEKTFEDKLDDIRRREEQQKERYSATKAELDYLREQRLKKAEARHKMQEAHREDITKQKGVQYDLIKQSHEEKEEHVRQLHRRQQLEKQRMGQRLAQEVAEHQQKSIERLRAKNQLTMRHNYNRWTHRGRRVIDQLAESTKEVVSPETSTSPPQQQLNVSTNLTAQ